MVQRPVLMGHYALPWLVRIQQHIIGQLRWTKDVCIPRKALQ